MFIGREKELSLLEKLYQSNHFEFVVLYGRRRVGKTSLLSTFANKKNSIFYSAQEKNDSLNLSDFSELIQKHFDGSSYGSFESWKSAFEYIGNRVSDERFLLIIDEFPFLATENASIKSTLQHTIDHLYKNKNIFLILCGSSVSFMEQEVLGYKSPLYGRSTAQLQVQPFDYYDSAKFFPRYSAEQKILAYGILGGIPCYLEKFNDSKSIDKNIEEQILDTGSFLREEPQVLLRMELREPAVYNSILEAISDGASKVKNISDRIHEETQKCTKYISILRSIKLLDKLTPAGESDSSKKTIYRISDNFLNFWYHFLFRDRSYFDILGAKKASEEIMNPENISTYMGIPFEGICTQYMIRKAKAGSLPFIPHTIGKWWGTNPIKKKPEDIDILLMDKNKEEGIFCECKYQNALFDKQELDDLISASKLFDDISTHYYYLFSKSGFTKYVKEQAANNKKITLISLDDLYLV